MKKILSLILCTVLLLSVSALPVNSADSINGSAIVNTQSTALNVRSSPKSGSTIKAKLSKNSYVTLINKSGNYWYIRYNTNGYGYAHSDYLKIASQNVKSVKTNSGRLRVRSSASANSTIKDYLSSGTEVSVLSTSGNFSRIVYNGNKTGYVSSGYLVKQHSFTNKYSKISLKVPDYKQYDSRWANVTLGNSGQSIQKIGCATTALAMTESYKTGTTIYPHNMAKKLSYTSGGAVYWPTSYTIITNSSGYLTTIYNSLKAGKPVIVGAKNSYGGQHYVVVTGVKETDTLTTSAFYINDPGSATRVTLNQFFASYPNFYKMLHAK